MCQLPLFWGSSHYAGETSDPSDEAFTSLPVRPLFWVLTAGQCVGAEAPWGKFSGPSWRSLLPPPPPPPLHAASCRKKWKLLSHEGCVLLCVWDNIMSPARGRRRRRRREQYMSGKSFAATRMFTCVKPSSERQLDDAWPRPKSAKKMSLTQSQPKGLLFF